jgi:hypothetical protein
MISIIIEDENAILSIESKLIDAIKINNNNEGDAPDSSRSSRMAAR